MTVPADPSQPSRRLDRRSLIRAGAAVAGAGAATAAGAAAATPAAAADGQPVVQGRFNDATSSTHLRVGGAAGRRGTPALILTNAAGGALRLSPRSGDEITGLTPGELATTLDGPWVGVRDGRTDETVPVVTAIDLVDALSQIPVTIPISPARFLDTRNSSGRENVVRTSPGAFRSDGRLNAGAWVELLIDPLGVVAGVFANLTVVRPLRDGYALLYPGPGRPNASTVNYTVGQNASNSTLSATAITSDGDAVIRVFTLQAAWIVLDLNGAIVLPGGDDSAQGRAGAARRPSGLSAQRLAAARRLAARDVN